MRGRTTDIDSRRKRCERRVWVRGVSGVNGGYFTCWGRLDGATCGKCGYVTPPDASDNGAES